jgi:hypothetical protein
LAAAREIKSESKKQNALPKANTPMDVADVSESSSPIAQEEEESLIQEIERGIEEAYELPDLINKFKNMPFVKKQFRRIQNQTLAMVKAVYLTVRPENSKPTTRDSNDG